MRVSRDPAKQALRLPTQIRCAYGRGFELSVLEQRLLMSTAQLHDDRVDTEEIVNGMSILPAISQVAQNATPAASTTAGTVAAASVPLSSVPALNSRPGAAAKLYLDFNGDTTATWGSYKPGTTPAYDQDGDPTTFSDGEIANIRDIWARVAEKYSPFNINVTTVDPGNLTDKVTTRVVIGGNGAWLGSSAGGIGYVGGFYNSASNTVFVFPKNLGGGNSKYVAEASAHEAGHNFGLQHQSTYSGTTKTSEYNSGTSAKAPIMGVSYNAARGLWWNGPSSTSSTSIQDDLSILSGTNDGFGYRADDYGNTVSSAAPLTVSGTSVSAAGVIEKTSDMDVFSFNAAGGSVSLKASPASAGGMLDLKLELRKSDGTLITSADTSSLGETLSTTLAAGTYYVDVASHGSYGDIGQYTISGTLTSSSTPTPTPTPNAPSNLTAQAISSSQINLAWTGATGATGYRIERSLDGSTGWATIGTTAATVTTFQNTGLSASTTYYYRVLATNSSGASAPSATASARTQAGTTTTLIPAAPTNLIATATSTTAARLTWQDNSNNESGFSLQWSPNNSTWYTLGSAGANVTSISVSGMTAGRTYYFRVYATNSSGKSPASNVANVTTPLATPTAGPSLAALFSTTNATPIASSEEPLLSTADRMDLRAGWSLRQLFVSDRQA